MPSNAAAQAQQNQQNQQNQAEQFLAQQRQQAESQWQNFFSNNPSPASTWGAIKPPSFAGEPTTLGGGYIGGSGKLKDAMSGMPPPPQPTAAKGKK
jgi:hypothetical protein